VRREEQTLAAYPAPLVPPPVPRPGRSIAGGSRLRAVCLQGWCREHKRRWQGARDLRSGVDGPSRAVALKIAKSPAEFRRRQNRSFEIVLARRPELLLYRCHIDITSSPNTSPFSLAGDPADRSHNPLCVPRKTVAGVLQKMHQMSGRCAGRRVTRNTSGCPECPAPRVLAGGIGVTP